MNIRGGNIDPPGDRSSRLGCGAGEQNASLAVKGPDGVFQNQVRAIIQAQDCALRLFLIASTNSAASIHLPVPLVTEPTDAARLTEIFYEEFFVLHCRWPGMKKMRAR
jgi:hypothetical protein